MLFLSNAESQDIKETNTMSLLVLFLKMNQIKKNVILKLSSDRILYVRLLQMETVRQRAVTSNHIAER